MSDPKPDLSPGWVDRLPRTATEQEAASDAEHVRAGKRPRPKPWSGHCDVKQASRLRGAHKRGKGKLPEVRFVEDEVE